MGFNIWAVGLTGSSSQGLFKYEKKNCLDRSDFDPPKLLSIIPDSPDAAGIAKKISGTPESHLGSATVDGMSKVAELIFAHHVIQGIQFLALHGSGGSVSVYCNEAKWYWADSNSFVEYRITSTSGIDPGKEFLKKIGPGLKNTSLNNFGVLAQIAICLSKYESALPQSAKPNLRIELRH